MSLSFLLGEIFTSHESHFVTDRSSVSLVFPGGPGSDKDTIGIAKLIYAFWNYSKSTPLIILHTSKAYKPAIAAVVVAKAGIILPAFNLTVRKSISSSL